MVDSILVGIVVEEVEDPERNLPRGIFLSLSVVCSIYVLISLALVGVVPLEVFSGSKTPLAATARAATTPTWTRERALNATKSRCRFSVFTRRFTGPPPRGHSRRRRSS